jgi:hypothetical protein
LVALNSRYVHAVVFSYDGRFLNLWIIVLLYLLA